MRPMPKSLRRPLLRGACALLLAAAAVREGAAQTASIRISSDPPGATVTLDGTVYDVSPVVIPDIAPGEHLLVLNKEGYREARRTLRLEAGQRVVADIRLEPVFGLVLVHSTPPGAIVRIDDADKGETPLLISDLPLGSYRMQLTAPGYQTSQTELRVTDRRPVKITIDLVSESAALEIRSEPPGVDVVLNGISMGATPCDLARIPAGENTLELSLAGYEPFRQTIRLQAGQKERIDVALKPIPSRLTVVSTPPGARVYLDDQFRGEAPVAIENLPPGVYRVRTEARGYLPMARSVSIVRNTDQVEEFRMESNSGTLVLTTEPAGVQVFIDGEDAGVTTASTGQTDRVSLPFTVALLTVGPHKLQLNKEGYFASTVTVDIKRDETATLHERLKRRFIPNYEVVTRTGVERGVLLEIDPIGNIRIEVRPGVVKTIPVAEVKEGRPLRDDR